MTLYNQIKNSLEHNPEAYPVTEDEHGEYTIYTSIKSDGYIRSSYLKDTLEECLNSLGITIIAEKDINNYAENSNEKIVSYYLPPRKKFEKGDLVDILPQAKETGGYDDLREEVKEMARQKGLEIRNILDNSNGIYYEIYNKDKSDYFIFLARYIVPHIPEETQAENEIIITADMVGKKVKIIKE